MKFNLLLDFLKLTKALKKSFNFINVFIYFSILIIFIEMIGISVVPIIIINF